MAIMASWRDKKWEISPQKIYALQNLTTSFSIKTETKTTKDGKEEKIIKGLDLVPLNFETKLSDAVGIDVLKEIENWKSLVGQTGSFQLGGRRFLADTYLLESVSANEIVTDDFGRVRSAILTFSFTEESRELTSEIVSSSSAGPSKKEKQSKKIINSQIISASNIITSV